MAAHHSPPSPLISNQREGSSEAPTTSLTLHSFSEDISKVFHTKRWHFVLAVSLCFVVSMYHNMRFLYDYKTSYVEQSVHNSSAEIESANSSISNSISSTLPPSVSLTATFSAFKNETTDHEGNEEETRATTDHEGNEEETRATTEDDLQPHLGARFPNGTLGYVANVKSVRERVKKEMELLQKRYDLNFHGYNKTFTVSSFNYLPMTMDEYEEICNKEPSKSLEKEEGFEILAQVVQLHRSYPFSSFDDDSNDDEDIDTREDLEERKDKRKEELHSEGNSATNTSKNTTLNPPPKILCSIYTTEANHDRIEVIAETWGWRCDGFFAASTLTNETIGAVNLTHLGPEAYMNMWQKTRSIWSYIYDHYLDDYDFFWLGGDDVFMITENLRYYLWNLTESIGVDRVQNEPLYLGHRFYKHESHFPHRYIIGGGPGYVMNRYALRELVSNGLPNCFTGTIKPNEDTILSNCFRDILGITGNHTVDEENKQIFHGMDPLFIGKFKAEGGFFKDVYEYWGKLYGFKVGKDLVSKHSVTFHNVKYPLFMKRFHAIVYNICPADTVVGDMINNLQYGED